MAFRLGLAPCGYPSDGVVTLQVEAYAQTAAQAGVRLLAFPENLAHPQGVPIGQLEEYAHPLDGKFVRSLSACARREGIWLAFTMLETNPTGGRPFNTAVLLDDQGAMRTAYRKCHLYDAHQERESDRMSAGSALCEPVRTPFCTLGLGICYDLRFPEVSRALAIGGCDVQLFPASWVDGPHKRMHWQTLLAARAIENECFVAGICRRAKGLVAASAVYGPLGQALALEHVDVSGYPDDALLVATIDTDEVPSARDAMPIMQHRRPELYRRLLG